MTVETLDQLGDRLASIKRRRTPVEASLDLTNAYIECLFAVGYARVGEPEVARARCQSARGTLAKRLGDPGHAWLIDAFEACTELAISGRPDDPLDEALVDRLESLDRVSRYKVDRLRETCRLLEPDPRGIDAMLDFQTRQSSIARRAGRDVIAERTRWLRSALDAAIAGMPGTASALSDCLLMTSALPEAFAVECLDRALDHLSLVPVSFVGVFERALWIVRRTRRVDRIPQILEAFRSVVDPLPVAERANQLGGMAMTLLRIEPTLVPSLQRELEELAATHRDDKRVVGEVKLLKRVRSSPPREPNDNERVAELLRTLHSSVAAVVGEPRDVALADISSFADQFASVTDSYGTNSHFCLSALAFVDMLVGAVARVGERTGP